MGWSRPSIQPEDLNHGGEWCCCRRYSRAPGIGLGCPHITSLYNGHCKLRPLEPRYFQTEGIQRISGNLYAQPPATSSKRKHQGVWLGPLPWFFSPGPLGPVFFGSVSSLTLESSSCAGESRAKFFDSCHVVSELTPVISHWPLRLIVKPTGCPQHAMAETAPPGPFLFTAVLSQVCQVHQVHQIPDKWFTGGCHLWGQSCIYFIWMLWGPIW